MRFICAVSLLGGVTDNKGTLKTAEACQNSLSFDVIRKMWGGKQSRIEVQ